MVTETWEWAKGADGKWTRPLFANEIFMAVKSQVSRIMQGKRGTIRSYHVFERACPYLRNLLTTV